MMTIFTGTSYIYIYVFITYIFRGIIYIYIYRYYKVSKAYVPFNRYRSSPTQAIPSQAASAVFKANAMAMQGHKDSPCPANHRFPGQSPTEMDISMGESSKNGGFSWIFHVLLSDGNGKIVENCLEDYPFSIAIGVHALEVCGCVPKDL